jgi:positive control factor
LIPDIAEKLKEEGDINKKHLFMTREEKVIMADILASFSLREQTCHILHEGQKMSMAKIAVELGISKGTVQG